MRITVGNIVQRSNYNNDDVEKKKLHKIPNERNKNSSLCNGPKRKRLRVWMRVVCISTEIDYYYISVINFRRMVHYIGTCMWCAVFGNGDDEMPRFVGLFIFILTTQRHFYAIDVPDSPNAVTIQRPTMKSVWWSGRAGKCYVLRFFAPKPSPSWFHLEPHGIFIEIHLANASPNPFTRIFSQSICSLKRLIAVFVVYLHANALNL